MLPVMQGSGIYQTTLKLLALMSISVEAMRDFQRVIIRPIKTLLLKKEKTPI